MIRNHDGALSRKSGLITVMLLLLLGCAPEDRRSDQTTRSTGADLTTESIAGQASQPSTHVVMLGDSLTAGYRLSPGEALPSALERRLQARGLSVRIVNAGVSGDTTGDALNRYEFSVADLEPDLLVIAIGANDYLNGLDPAQAQGNISSLLEKAREDGIPAALVGLAPPPKSANDAASPARLDYERIYPDLARRYDAPLFPNMLSRVAGRPELLQDDGLHPTAEGIEAIAEDMTPFLEPLVRLADTSSSPTR